MSEQSASSLRRGAAGLLGDRATLLLAGGGLAGVLLFLLLAQAINRRLAFSASSNAEALAEVALADGAPASTLARLADRAPAVPYVQLDAAQALAREGRREEAARYLQRAAELMWADHAEFPLLFSDYHRGRVARGYFDWGAWLLETGETHDGLEVLRFAVAIDEALAEEAHRQALAHATGATFADNAAAIRFLLDTDGLEAAEELLGRESTGDSPRNYHLLRGLMLRAHGLEAEAQEAFRDELRRHPDNIEAVLQIAGPDRHNQRLAEELLRHGFEPLTLVDSELPEYIVRSDWLITIYTGEAPLRVEPMRTTRRVGERVYCLYTTGMTADVGAMMRVRTAGGEQLWYCPRPEWSARPVDPAPMELRLLNPANAVRYQYEQDASRPWHLDNRHFLFGQLWHRVEETE